MSSLAVTLIDVGWGDCILVAANDDKGHRRFGLVDCNDSERQRTALAFVKIYLERLGIDWKQKSYNFEWMLLTHGHADHARGLREMMRTFGTRHFWYPKSVPSTTYGVLLDYANRSNRVLHHQAIDETKILAAPEVDFPVEMRVLWPNYDQIDTQNENNNSVVLALIFGETSIVLTGDAEAENWPQIVPRLPPDPTYIQVPGHGARNGIFDSAESTTWLDGVNPKRTRLVVSSNVVPRSYPHPDVIAELNNREFVTYRTDLSHHVTLISDGSKVTVRYSHISGRLPR